MIDLAGFFAQFGNPHGRLGWLVGQLMAVKNGARSRWALGLLAAKPGERVLEIGFGPGVDVRRLERAVGAAGKVAGVDVSDVMLRQALARNRAGVAAARVELCLGSVAKLPFADGAFDAVYSTNCAQFWPDVAQGMGEIARVLRPGGRAVVVVQPMSRGATEADASRWRDRLADAMRAGGLAAVETALQPMRPVSAAVALGKLDR